MPTPTPPTHLSRRFFLKGAGVSAAAAALADSTLAHAADLAPDEPKPIGPNPAPLTLNINGQSHQLQAEPCTTLADALRMQLDLTGTKVVCDRGACSACTVFLDGTPVCSCMTLAHDVGNRKITTIEGLAQGDTLHPVQQSFIDHDALQCGFCTPGMIMSCTALLNRNPHPTEDDVRQATSGNLCRCGTYPKVFAATLDAATKSPIAAKDT